MKPHSVCVLLLSTLALTFSGCGETENLYDFDSDGSLDAEDCAPSDPAVYPGADDLFGDGIDSNCDGADGNAADQDLDGYTNVVDCDADQFVLYLGRN